MTSKTNQLALLAVLTAAAVALFLNLERNPLRLGDDAQPGHGKVVDALIERNVAARGGADAWRAVTALRVSGLMDLGQELYVPYVLEQKRPGKMCLSFEFAEQTAVQCVDGDAGWKQLPFMGREAAEAMSDDEVREIAAAADPRGMLFDSYQRGIRVESLGQETVDGRSTTKLQVTMPGGAQRWIYLDDATGLEVRLETLRRLRGQERLMETTYSDWAEIDGLMIPRRQDTRYRGDDESHFVTVDSVLVNPQIADDRFAMPAAAG